MQLIMEDKNVRTVEQVKQFLEGSQYLEFTATSMEEKYEWVEGVVRKFAYSSLKKAEKGVVRQYLQKVTGYSRAQRCRRNRSPTLYRRRFPMLPADVIIRRFFCHRCASEASIEPSPPIPDCG